jgi:hypothetical protein
MIGVLWGGARRARLPLVIGGGALLLGVSGIWTRPAPLENTFPSAEQAAQAVIEAMRAGDLDSLRALALTEDEFREHVWPELPASRRERNVPFEFVWDTLHQNSEGHLHETLARLRDQSLTLKRVDFAGPSTTYGDVTVYRNSRIVVVAPDGGERSVKLLGSMIQQNGRWKVFSFVVDD